MNQKILILIVGIFFLSFASAIEEPLIYYKLTLDYSYGEIQVNSTDIEFSNKQIENLFGFYSATILDSDGNLLNLSLFDVPNEILYDTIDEETGEINGGGFLELNETEFEIFIPYYENAKEIVIYNESLTELTRKNIQEFSKVQEEKSVGEIIEKNEKEQPIEKESFETTIEKLQQYWWILVVVLIALIFYLAYSLGKKK